MVCLGTCIWYLKKRLNLSGLLFKSNRLGLEYGDQGVRIVEGELGN